MSTVLTMLSTGLVRCGDAVGYLTSHFCLESLAATLESHLGECPRPQITPRETVFGDNCPMGQRDLQHERMGR